MEFNLRDRLILLVLAGSRSYGLHTPESDVDIKGVCVPPIDEYRLGPHSFEQADGKEHILTLRDLLSPEEQEVSAREPLEGTVYDITKFVQLCLNANPNILEVLFCPEEDVRFTSPVGKLLRENRQIFLSKKVAYSYHGYAFAQMKKIRTHRGWLLNPAEREPQREDFNLLPDRSVLNADEQNAFLWVLAEILRDKVSESRLSKETKEELLSIGLFDAVAAGVPEGAWPAIQQITGAPEAFILTMQRERAYKAARAHWKSFLNWKATRNPKRAVLEGQYGFDLKHAMHLARLMVQGRSILETGTLEVKISSPQREWLLGIREGRMTFEELESWFEQEQKNMSLAAQSSLLPKNPDKNAAEELLITIQKYYGRECSSS